MARVRRKIPLQCFAGFLQEKRLNSASAATPTKWKSRLQSDRARTATIRSRRSPVPPSGSIASARDSCAAQPTNACPGPNLWLAATKRCHGSGGGHPPKRGAFPARCCLAAAQRWSTLNRQVVDLMIRTLIVLLYFTLCIVVVLPWLILWSVLRGSPDF